MSPPGERWPGPDGEDARGPGLYIHVPFCARACPYCDFDFEVGREPPVGPYLDALERERRGRGMPSGMPVDTVYVGGGTPSQLGAAGLAALLAWLRERFDLRGTRELTVELNPEHVDPARLEALVSAGVDRVSLGVQSLATEGLVQLGRVHRAARAREALRAVTAAGLRVSADLIVGWPGQTAASLEADLAGLVESGVEHVSIYALTIEPDTPWEALVRRGRRRVPDPDVVGERLEHAAGPLVGAGFEHYEVASYARPGARSLHNLRYWTWGDYVGLGPSAASARYEADGAVWRRTNPRGLARWQAEPAAAGAEERLSSRRAAAEGLWVGLRVLTGFEEERYLARFAAVDAAWLRARTAAQIARGNLSREEGRLRVAEGRWLWHDDICADLLGDEGGSH